MYDFRERVISQIEYYEQFKEWLSRRKNVIKVWDAELIDDKQGTDLYIENINEDVFRVQVKVDHWSDTTKNLPFETISQAYSTRNSVIGAEFSYEKVDYIAFILSHSKNIFVYKFQPLLAYVIAHYEDFKNFGADNPRYRTLGCLVPMKKVECFIKLKGNLLEVNKE